LKVRLLMVAVVAVATVLGVGSAVGAAQSPPAGGPIYVHVTPGNGRGPIVITGAIGDYGTSVNVDRNGKPNSNGNFAKVTLKKGSFEVNLKVLNAKQNKTQPHFNQTTCSGTFGPTTAPVTLFNGKGLYMGISGKVNITLTFGFIAPVYTSGAHKGQCNMSNNVQPLAQWVTAGGPGIVRFS
jgi:hypothetical protein